jgi:hypothetical protein
MVAQPRHQDLLLVPAPARELREGADDHNHAQLVPASRSRAPSLPRTPLRRSHRQEPLDPTPSS